MPTSNFDELPVSGGVVSAEKMPFHLAQAILLCLDDGCDRTEILSLKEDGATAALDDYDRKIKWKADWVQQVADFVDENAGPLGWDYDGDEQSVLTQLLNATKKKRRRVVPAAGGGNVASPKSPRSVAGSLKMPRRAAPRRPASSRSCGIRVYAAQIEEEWQRAIPLEYGTEPAELQVLHIQEMAAQWWQDIKFNMNAGMRPMVRQRHTQRYRYR